MPYVGPILKKKSLYLSLYFCKSALEALIYVISFVYDAAELVPAHGSLDKVGFPVYVKNAAAPSERRINSDLFLIDRNRTKVLRQIIGYMGEGGGGVGYGFSFSANYFLHF